MRRTSLSLSLYLKFDRCLDEFHSQVEARGAGAALEIRSESFEILPDKGQFHKPLEISQKIVPVVLVHLDHRKKFFVGHQNAIPVQHHRDEIQSPAAARRSATEFVDEH